VVVAVVFMAAVEGAFTAVAACTPVEEAEPAEDRIQGLRLATGVQLRARLPLRVRRTAIIPDLAVISRAGINVMEIRQVHLRLRTGGGILLQGQPEAVDLQARHLSPDPLVTLVASTYLARIAEPDRAAQFGAFRGRAAKCGKILPLREMSFPNLNHFPRFTIRSAAQAV
jgi:hypothetical protein